MSNFTFEYNEDVQGFIVKSGNEEANLQYCYLNKEMLFNVDGGYVSDGFTSDMLEAAYEEAQQDAEVMRVEKLLREAYENKREEIEEITMQKNCLPLCDLEELLEEKVRLLAADTLNGVYEVSKLPDNEGTHSYEVFRDNLDSLADDEVMYCYATQDEAAHIDLYYGIKLL